MSKRNDFSADYELSEFVRYMQRANAIPTKMSQYGIDIDVADKLIRQSADEEGKLFKTKTKELVQLLRIEKPEHVSESLFLKQMASLSRDIVNRFVDRYDPEKNMFSNIPDNIYSVYKGTDQIYKRYEKTAECLSTYQRDKDRQAIARACVLNGKPVVFDFRNSQTAPGLLMRGMSYTVNTHTISRNNGNFQPEWDDANFTEKVVDYYKSASGLFMVEFADKIFVSDDISIHYYKAYKEYEQAQQEREKMQDPQFVENKNKVFGAMEEVSQIINGLDKEFKGNWLSQFGELPQQPVDHRPDISDMYTFVGYTRELFDAETEYAKNQYASEMDKYTHDIAKYVKNVYEACLSAGIPIIHATPTSSCLQSTVILETREPGVPMEFVDFFNNQLPAPGTTIDMPNDCKFAGTYAGCEELTNGMKCTVLETIGSGNEFAILTDKGVITSCDMETIYQNLLLARNHELEGSEIEDQEHTPGGDNR